MKNEDPSTAVHDVKLEGVGVACVARWKGCRGDDMKAWMPPSTNKLGTVGKGEASSHHAVFEGDNSRGLVTCVPHVSAGTGIEYFDSSILPT
jgi:hypothetical protein